MLIEEFKDAFKEVEDNYLAYEEITNNLLKSYIGDLDELIEDFNKDAVEGDIDDRSLQKYLLEIGNKLYFLSSKMESLGIKEDLSKMLYKEEYNFSYLANREKDSERKNKLTVAELTAIAESESKQRQVVNVLYSRIYSQIKMKTTAAYDLVNSIRKIISKRMQDQNLSYSMPQGPNVYNATE